MAVGRPRAFNMEKALDSALIVFWQKGYEGTSLPDLTAAMGINRPSLYAAFGNKEELFRKALERYKTVKGNFFHEALKEKNIRKVIEKILYGMADNLTNPDNPCGCLAVQGALSCGEGAEPIKQELAACRAASEEMLRDRLKKAKAEGDFPTTADPVSFARYICTVSQGMSIQASGGATRKQLYKVIDTALLAWPQ